MLDTTEGMTGLDTNAAVRLFVERARRVRHALDAAAELPAIAEICRVVGGMPLAIEAAAGRPALHTDVQRYLMRQSSAPAEPSLLATLTERERDLMRCLARGFSNRQIASALGPTHGTVKVYVSALLGKLGVADRTQAALLAARLAAQEQ